MPTSVLQIAEPISPLDGLATLEASNTSKLHATRSGELAASTSDLLKLCAKGHPLSIAQGEVSGQDTEQAALELQERRIKDSLLQLAEETQRRCNKIPVYGEEVRRAVSVFKPATSHCFDRETIFQYCDAVKQIVLAHRERCDQLKHLSHLASVVTQKAVVKDIDLHCVATFTRKAERQKELFISKTSSSVAPLCFMKLLLPERQYTLLLDSGKMQQLHSLLLQSKAKGTSAALCTHSHTLAFRSKSFSVRSKLTRFGPA